MALRAGYYGLKNSVKRTLEKLASDMAGAKIIKSVGNGLTLSDQGVLSAKIDDSTMEFINGKLSVKNGSSAFSIVEKDWALFNGVDHISLPFSVNENYLIDVSFDLLADSTQSVYGNSAGDSYSHLTRYQGNWYGSKGGSSYQFSGVGIGQHNYVENDDGTCKFDNVVVQSEFTPTTKDDAIIYVGYRASGGAHFTGKINNFTIFDVRDDSKVVELIPALIIMGDPAAENRIETPCLYDKVNHLYYANCIKSVGDYETP